MSNNTNNTIDCGWFSKERLDLEFFLVYEVFQVITVILAFFGCLVCFIIYFNLSKKESVYKYLLFVITNHCNFTLSLFDSILITFSKKSNNYAFEWFTSHVYMVWMHFCLTMDIFLTVALVSDHLFAVSKPTIYKCINRRRHQIFALFVCTFISFGSTLYETFRFVVNEHDGFYTLDETEFITTLFFTFSVQFRIAIRVAMCFLLVFLTIALLHFYRNALRKSNAIKGIIKPKDEKKQKKQERVIMVLSTFQCGFHFVFGVVTSIFNLGKVFYLGTQFGQCIGPFFGIAIDVWLLLYHAMSPYVFLFVNQQFYEIVSRYFSCFKKKSGTAVISLQK